MAEGKKSVLLYCDLIHTVEKMDDETAGKFFKHYLRYINDLNPETDNPIVDISFESVKQNLKRDLKKWENKAEKSRQNGKLGGRPPKKEETQKTQQVILEPRKPVKDTVTVTGNVTDTVNDISLKKKQIDIKLSEIKNPDEVKENEFDFIAYSFWELFKLNLLDSGISKTTLLDKAKLSKWSNEVRLMIEIDGRNKDELSTVYKFLKKDEFWKPNIQSITKLREKFEQLYSASKKAAPKDKRQANLDEVNESLRRDFEKIRNS